MEPSTIAVRRWVMNGDVQLALETRGTGRIDVLFVHGWISSRRMWYSCAERLPGDTFTGHYLDVRGCGESDRPLEGHDLDGYVSDVLAAMAAVGRPVLLVGHSMGARIIQRIAVDRPAGLAGVVLAAPGTASAAPVVSRQRYLATLACGSRRRISSFQRGAMRAEVAADVYERLIEDALYAQREHWFGWYDRGRTEDFSERLIAVNVPVIVLAGAEDPILPLSRVERDVAGKIPGTSVRVLSACGHNIPIEAPAAIVEALESLTVRAFGAKSAHTNI